MFVFCFCRIPSLRHRQLLTPSVVTMILFFLRYNLCFLKSLFLDWNLYAYNNHACIHQVNLSIDPINLLSTMISQHKYQEALTTALQMRDVSIVNWICSQVNYLIVLCY
jgi:hypothetical protein